MRPRDRAFVAFALLALALVAAAAAVAASIGDLRDVSPRLPRFESHAEAPPSAATSPLDVDRAIDSSREAIQSFAATPTSVVSASAELDIEDVLVVERETGAPIVGAEVCIRTWHDLHASSWDDVMRRLLDPFVGATNVARTDADGRAQVSIDRRGGWMAARTPDRWGWFEIELEAGHDSSPTKARRVDGVLRVGLPFDRTLDVEVVDRAGRPVAAAPVELVSVQAERDDWPYWRGVADANGHATIPHIQQHLARLPDGRSLAARLAVLGMDDEHTVLAPDATSVRLVMPPWGSVRVTTVDQRGVPVRVERARARTSWSFVKFEGESLSPVFFERGDWMPETETGVARHPFVVLGRQIEVCANLAEHDRVRVVGTGPTVQNEEARIELAFGPPCIVLTGTLRLDDGAPLANGTFDVEVPIEHEPTYDVHGSTDVEGRFRVVLGNDRPVGLLSTLQRSPACNEFMPDGSWEVPKWADRIGPCTIQFATSGDCRSANRSFRVDRALDLVRGENELGTLVVRGPPVIAAGRVVDARGRAVAETRVYAYDPSARSWRSPIASCDTDASGVFELRADENGSHVDLRTTSSYDDERPLARVERGAREIVLVDRP